jgi:peroxiredoxin
MIIILFISLLLIVNPAVYAEAIGIEVGVEAPDFTLSSTDGGKISLREKSGKVVVVIYWRSEQKRSLQAIDDCKSIYDNYREKGLEVIGIVPDTEDIEKVKHVIQDKGVDFPVLIDSGREYYGAYGVRVYPTTVIIDRERKLAKAIPGHALTYRRTLEGNVKHILGEIDEKQLQEVLSPQQKVKAKTELEAERKYNLALKFTESGLMDQAIDAAKGAINADPGIARSHELLGFLFLEEKEADMAMEQFNKALEIEPTSNDARTGLGGAMLLKGDIDSAIEVLNEAAKINPYPQMTFYELGRAYELKGDKDKAIEMYKKALNKIIRKQILPSAISKCR